jgi:hypothetical protein
VTKLKEWNTYTCRYHTELKELLSGLNDMRSLCRGVHRGCQCLCSVICRRLIEDFVSTSNSCEATKCRFSDVTKLGMSILCPLPPFSAWHKLECLMGTCDSCGIHKLQFCPTELSTNFLIKWHRVSYVVVGKNRSGGEKKVPQLEYMETPPRVLIEYLKPKLVEYVLHNFILKWQEKEVNRTLSRLQPDTIFSWINFSQNYLMKV